MAVADSNEQERLDPRDREYVETLDAGERDVVVSTLLRYRREPQVGIVDRLPELEVLELQGGRRVPLGELLDERPLVLVFGSFT